MEAHLNRYAGAETVARRCPAYGGYGSVAQMRADADKNLSRARALGATAIDVKKARERVNGNFMGVAFLVGAGPACDSFVNNLAWEGSSASEIQPKKPQAQKK
jgi:hypothetical protein